MKPEDHEPTPPDGEARWKFKLQAIDIVGPMTLGILLFLAFEENSFFEYLIFTKFLLLALIWPTFRRTCYVWFGSVLLLMPKLIFEWCDHEDHIYFATYWCAALGLATASRKATAKDADLVMRKSARLLLGLCFLFAFMWKITSPQFYEAEMFHHKLVSDSRFAETLARFPGGLDQETLKLNKANLDKMSSSLSETSTAQLSYNTQFSLLATGMTWWTIFIEGVLGIGFLLPASSRTNLIRNLSLIGFSISTYIIAPVVGFGFTFMAMGYANCEQEEKRTKCAYILCSIALLLIIIFRDEVVSLLS